MEDIHLEDLHLLEHAKQKNDESAEDFQLSPALLRTPFKKIAMALSGGGFRAAAYSLGAMSYLNQLEYPDLNKPGTVLNNVEFISTASGGTFAGMLYSMHVRLNIPFSTTYSTLLSFMNGEVLLENVLERINDPSKWDGEKSRNLINAFASIYSEKLLNHQTFGLYWRKENETSAPPMEVCFNTTELYRGQSFRFQAANDYSAFRKIGNAYVFFNYAKDPLGLKILQAVRLGDILAASSCFPGGFEPILFPKDFAYRNQAGETITTMELRQALVINNYDNIAIDSQDDIGLMDGGIDDNQGLYSAMLADKRRRGRDPENGFDLIFITDVASYFMDKYVEPAPVEEKGITSNSIYSLANFCRKGFRQIKNFITATTWITLLLLLTSLVVLFRDSIQFHDLFLGVACVSGTLLLIALSLKKWVLNNPVIKKAALNLELSNDEAVSFVRKQLPAANNFSDLTVGLLLKFLQKTPLFLLQQMLKARINSTLSIVMDINLKQTRRLIFNIFYGNFYGQDVWENRRVFNVIYELSSFNHQSRLATLNKKFNQKKYILPHSDHLADSWVLDSVESLTSGCEALEKVAENARTMNTTLWFDQRDAHTERMKDVVACGQFSTCVKLLEYTMIIARLIELQDKDPSAKRMIEFDETQKTLFNKIKQQLEKDWESFKTDPHFMRKLYDAQTQIATN